MLGFGRRTFQFGARFSLPLGLQFRFTAAVFFHGGRAEHRGLFHAVKRGAILVFLCGGGSTPL